MVSFLPSGRKLTTIKLTNLKDIIFRANLNFSFPCGGKGSCGKCKVKIKGNINSPTQKEKKLIPEDLKKGYRLACQVILKGDARVEFLKSSLISTLQILTLNSKEIIEINPPIKKVFLSLAPPTLKDQVSDISRVKRELKKKGWNRLQVDINVVRKVPYFLRESCFKVTCVLDEGKLITVEREDTRGKNFGMAFDIGTTTLVGTLIDLDTGERITTQSALNPQNNFGFDVISRISYIQQKGYKGLLELQKSVINKVNQIVDKLTKQTKLRKDNIYRLVIAGNTVMQHLIAGINPLNLGLYPFVPVLQDALSIKSSDLKIKINPSAMIYILPNIAAFVGGDTVGLILTTMLHRETDKVRLAVDIGTNGEIVLSHRGKLVALSTAAGPAFEGVRICQGMMAEEGAIEKFELREGTAQIKVIGGGEVRGICGSGLVDIVSELYREGIVDSSGRIKPRNRQKKLWADRVSEEKGERKFVLVKNKDGPCIFISQKDIREFQLAKAAISTGIKILLKRLQVNKDEVDDFLIAGAFGNYINLESAYRTGLFPFFPGAEVKMVGNAASLGAIKVLISRNAQREAEIIPSLVEHVELATASDFHQILSESMFLGELKGEGLC
ncbi:DUF4445 domain-containing protein [Candidatus Aerophobetes bacterium]|nr:DUF4445 domain-containing protein [Candidatus Aerophobetes bacterium]